MTSLMRILGTLKSLGSVHPSESISRMESFLSNDTVLPPCGDEFWVDAFEVIMETTASWRLTQDIMVPLDQVVGLILVNLLLGLDGLATRLHPAIAKGAPNRASLHVIAAVCKRKPEIAPLLLPHIVIPPKTQIGPRIRFLALGAILVVHFPSLPQAVLHMRPSLRAVFSTSQAHVAWPASGLPDEPYVQAPSIPRPDLDDTVSQIRNLLFPQSWSVGIGPDLPAMVRAASLLFWGGLFNKGHEYISTIRQVAWTASKSGNLALADDMRYLLSASKKALEYDFPHSSTFSATYGVMDTIANNAADDDLLLNLEDENPFDCSEAYLDFQFMLSHMPHWAQIDLSNTDGLYNGFITCLSQALQFSASYAFNISDLLTNKKYSKSSLDRYIASTLNQGCLFQPYLPTVQRMLRTLLGSKPYVDIALKHLVRCQVFSNHHEARLWTLAVEADFHAKAETTTNDSETASKRGWADLFWDRICIARSHTKQAMVWAKLHDLPMEGLSLYAIRMVETILGNHKEVHLKDSLKVVAKGMGGNVWWVQLLKSSVQYARLKECMEWIEDPSTTVKRAAPSMDVQVSRKIGRMDNPVESVEPVRDKILDSERKLKPMIARRSYLDLPAICRLLRQILEGGSPSPSLETDLHHLFMDADVWELGGPQDRIRRWRLYDLLLRYWSHVPNPEEDWSEVREFWFRGHVEEDLGCIGNPEWQPAVGNMTEVLVRTMLSFGTSGDIPEWIVDSMEGMHTCGRGEAGEGIGNVLVLVAMRSGRFDFARTKFRHSWTCRLSDIWSGKRWMINEGKEWRRCSLSFRPQRRIPVYGEEWGPPLVVTPAEAEEGLLDEGYAVPYVAGRVVAARIGMIELRMEKGGKGVMRKHIIRQEADEYVGPSNDFLSSLEDQKLWISQIHESGAISLLVSGLSSECSEIRGCAASGLGTLMDIFRDCQMNGVDLRGLELLQLLLTLTRNSTPHEAMDPAVATFINVLLDAALEDIGPSWNRLLKSILKQPSLKTPIRTLEKYICTKDDFTVDAAACLAATVVDRLSRTGASSESLSTLAARLASYPETVSRDGVPVPTIVSSVLSI